MLHWPHASAVGWPASPRDRCTVCAACRRQAQAGSQSRTERADISGGDPNRDQSYRVCCYLRARCGAPMREGRARCRRGWHGFGGHGLARRRDARAAWGWGAAGGLARQWNRCGWTLRSWLASAKLLSASRGSSLDGLFNDAKGSSNRLNLLVQGFTVIQLLENGLRPQYLYMKTSSGGWDALGVTYNKDLSTSNVRANMPDSARLGGFVVQARLIAGATMDRNGVPGRPCTRLQAVSELGATCSVCAWPAARRRVFTNAIHAWRRG